MAPKFCAFDGPPGACGRSCSAWGRRRATVRRCRVGEVAELRPEARDRRASPRSQHGVVTSAQLVAAGWRHGSDPGAGPRRVAAQRLHRGVYLVGPLETPHTAAMAAVLATGGVISHYPAAVLWDWRPPRDEPIDVTLPTGAHNRPGITVHRATLHPADVTRRHGIPVTSAARTILDLAATGRRARPGAERGRCCSGASACIPSMSSSAVTHATKARRHRRSCSTPSPGSPAPRRSARR